MIIRPVGISLASLMATALVFSLGCSSTSTSNPATGGDAGAGEGGGGDGSAGAGMVTQKGKCVELGQSVGVAGATVDLGGHSAVTMDAPMKGVYAIAVPINTPFFMTVSEPGHVKLIEQEWSLGSDYDRSTTGLVDLGTEMSLVGLLAGYDPAKGVLGVGIIKSTGGACADEAGATIALATPGTSKVAYFKGGFPSAATTTVQSGETTPSAIIYNIDPTADLTLTVTPPAGCTLDTFPHTETTAAGTITYTGKAKVEAGNTTSFTRVFVK